MRARCASTCARSRTAFTIACVRASLGTAVRWTCCVCARASCGSLGRGVMSPCSASGEGGAGLQSSGCRTFLGQTERLWCVFEVLVPGKHPHDQPRAARLLQLSGRGGGDPILSSVDRALPPSHTHDDPRRDFERPGAPPNTNLHVPCIRRPDILTRCTYQHLAPLQRLTRPQLDT